MAENGKSPMIVFPATSLAAILGFALTVLAVIAIAKRVPVLKTWV